MKIFTEYLNPVSKWKPKEWFPEKPNEQDIIDYLHSYGFSEVPNNYPTNYDLYDIVQYISKISEDNKLRYIIGNKISHDSAGDYKWIRFWYGKVTPNNPIYFVKMTTDGHMPDNIYCAMAAIEISTGRQEEINSYDDFKLLIDSLKK